MNYTIMNAIGSRYIVDLSKDRNQYTVGVWDKRNSRLEACEKFYSFEMAEQWFESRCSLYNVSEFIKEVEPDCVGFFFE